MNFKGTRLQKSAKSWRGDDFKKFAFIFDFLSHFPPLI